MCNAVLHRDSTAGRSVLDRGSIRRGRPWSAHVGRSKLRPYRNGSRNRCPARYRSRR
jgi:hypothetical protein